jgi:YtkA-like
MSDGGKLQVALRSTPFQPLVAGLQCIELVVTDASSGATVDGLAITMTPWMPAMDHGASVTPLLTPLGQGRYVFTNVSLFMPGEWQLRTQFTGQVTDSVEPTFNVD